MKNKRILIEMLTIYNFPKIDWMGYKISKDNYISYHHILEKRNGGKETVDNGALLSKYSHLLLHLIETKNNELYNKWQLLFKYLNELRKPLSDIEYNKIIELKNETINYIVSLNDIENSTLLLNLTLK